MPRVRILMTAAALVALASGVGNAQVRSEALERSLDGSVGSVLAAYFMYDVVERDGIGRSDATTSGGLGWGESSFLRNYMLCYQATEDTHWLDKVIDHFDRMIGNMTDPDGDGYLAWSDVDYSVGLATIKPVADVGAMEAQHASGRVYVKRGGELITGHNYRIEVVGGKLRVSDVTDDETLADIDHADPTVVEAIPGLKVTVTGEAVEGAAFQISTVAPEPCEYQVHDGMVTYPVAQFIEAACIDEDLPAKYRGKATEYAALIQKHFFEKWEPTWLDLGDGTGVYKFSTNPTQRFPDISAPHNQFLALARTWLVLQSDTVAPLVSVEQRALYRDRAEKMGRYFKQYLRDNGEAYVWNYWDPLPHEEGIGRNVEDIGHATIDIGFAVEATERGLVFDETDLERFAKTYSEVMWNGDADTPRFGARVDTNEGEKGGWSEWIQLGTASESVCALAAAIFEASGRTPSMGPQMVHLHDAVAGVTHEDIEAYRAGVEAAKSTLEDGALMNGAFEVGLPGAKSPMGWTLTEWSPAKGGQALWTDDGREGGKAISLVGGDDVVNLVAQPVRKLHGTGGQTVTVAACYRAEPAAKPDFSIIATDAAGERVQYDNSPRFDASDDWRLAEWTVELAEGTDTFTIILRNHGAGTVSYDDVSVTIE